MGKSIKNIFPLLCVFVVLMGLGYMLYHAMILYDVPATLTQEKVVSAQSPMYKLKSVSLEVPDLGTKVMLADGEVRFLVDGARALGMVRMGDLLAEEVSGETKHLVTYINVNNGGSGTFQYVTLFAEEKDDLVYKSSVLLGDRIRVQHITVVPPAQGSTNTKIVVDMLTRKQSQPMSAEPTVPTKRVFVIESENLVPSK